MKPAHEIAMEIVNSSEFAWADYLESDLTKQMHIIARAIEAARAEEREECAKLAEAWGVGRGDEGYMAERIAAAIRRGDCARAGERK